MSDTGAIREFLRTYAAAPVGPTPVQPGILEELEKPTVETINRGVEVAEADWKPITVAEQPAKPGEYPERFIDGSQAGQPVLCVRSPQGWPIAMVLSEVGAVALRSKGRRFEREFVAVERVLSFVADPFPWEQIEAFALDLLNRPELQLRLLPAPFPDIREQSPFDYEVMRAQARNRAQHEMRTLEQLAFARNKTLPTLVDGPLNRVLSSPDDGAPLLVGVAKTHSANHLHETGWRTLLNLGFSQRTPVFKHKESEAGSFTVASWYLKLAAGPQLAPNWGFVRVDMPWKQFEKDRKQDFGFIDRLSRWIIDARCRAESYARMPVSLEPIVRAEDALKPLFTPLPVLVNRLYRQAGFFRRNEL